MSTIEDFHKTLLTFLLDGERSGVHVGKGRYVGLLDENGKEPPFDAGYSRVVLSSETVDPGGPPYTVTFPKSTKSWGIISKFFIADGIGNVLFTDNLTKKVDTRPLDNALLTEYLPMKMDVKPHSVIILDIDIKIDNIINQPIMIRLQEPGNKTVSQPQDNSNRDTCYWCGKPTVKKECFTSTYDFCEKCGR